MGRPIQIEEEKGYRDPYFVAPSRLVMEIINENFDIQHYDLYSFPFVKNSITLSSMETQGTKSVKLDIEQFTNLHHCIEDWITETRQIFFEDLPPEQQFTFDLEQFERQKIEMLFKQFDHILLDDKDYFYVVKGSKVFPVSHCEGAWNHAVNSHIAV